LTDQIKKIDKLEGRIWESPLRDGVPAFRPTNGESPAIIAIANLKGGVGKTTLTANIGATYRRMGKRVLVVDLDHQTSLTGLCLNGEQIMDLRVGDGKYVSNVLEASANHASIAWNNLVALSQPDAFILAANKELADVEEQVKAHWLLHDDTPDSRYLLRAALHDRMIQERFDVILLDCPPRPSTCLINALTCCDFVLIPAKPDRPSTDTVPYLLAWLRKLKAQGICPDLKILGLVANMAYPRNKDCLISRERVVWNDVQSKCAQEWDERVHAFARFVPNSTQFAEAAAAREFAADHPKLESIFDDLVNELEEQRAHHASPSAAAVS
jgi:cellulose biosynthesis protein BcsQ